MSKRYLLFIIVILFLLGGLLVLLNVNLKNNPPDEVVSSDRSDLLEIFDLSFTDYSGKQVSLSDFADQPLVINSWAAWCTFCKQELIDFADLQDEFGDKVKIIAINRRESLAVAKEFSDKRDVTGRILLLLDSTDSFYRAIDGFSMPETIFVDANGSLLYHKRGVMKIDEIREKINNLIATN